MIGQGLDWAYQIPIGIRFQDVCAGAGINDVADELVGKMQRQDQNPHFRKQLMDSAGCLETIQVRHADVQHYDFRLELFSESNRFAPSFGLAANLPPWPRSEKLFQPPTDNVVIVCDENSHGICPRSQSSLLRPFFATQSKCLGA